MATIAMLSAGSRAGVGYVFLFTEGARYAAVGAVVVVVWLVGRLLQYSNPRITPPRAILSTGVFVAVAVATLLAWSFDGSVTLFWPTISIGAAVILTVGVWSLLERWNLTVTRRAGDAAGLLLFGQLLDAVTTMVGVDVLGFYERVTLSRLLIDATASLPVPPLFGSTWLFVLLKLGLAVKIVIWIGKSDNLTPFERQGVLGVVTAAGLIPAVNNLALQSIS